MSSFSSVCIFFRDQSQYSTSVRVKMTQMGLYEKFPAEEAMLTDFKGYLINTLQVPNCQQEVRYIPFAFLFSMFRIALCNLKCFNI